MGCPKNPKKFLKIFPYKGDHVWKIHEIRGATIYIHRVTLECSLCGIRAAHLYAEEELARDGFDLKRIRTIKEFDSVSGDELAKYRVSSEPKPIEDQWGDL